MSYDIHLDDKYGQMNLVDIPAELAANEPWFNQTLTTVNDSVVRLGIIEGDFHWHKHDADDEFFLVLEGTLLIDFEDRETVTLKPHQGYTVPRGVMHRTRAPERTAIVMVEPAESTRPAISAPSGRGNPTRDLRATLRSEVLRVELGVVRPLLRELVLGEARVDGTGLDAGVAVDALLWIDVEHLDLVVVGLVGRRVDAVHRTDLDARVVLGPDARFSDHIGHSASPRSSDDGERSRILGSCPCFC